VSEIVRVGDGVAGVAKTVPVTSVARDVRVIENGVMVHGDSVMVV